MSRVSSFQVLKRETGKMLYFTSYLLKAVECFADTFMKTRLNATCYDGTHHHRGNDEKKSEWFYTENFQTKGNCCSLNPATIS
jgi:hypothetical protein